MRKLLFLSFFVGVTSSASRGEGPTADKVKKAVARSLPYLEKEGVEWIEKRNCLSCHHVPFLLWSHNVAKAHGIPVDEKKLKEWTDWSFNSSQTNQVGYKLTEKGIEAIRAAKTVPEETLTKLKPLVDHPFRFEKEFLVELGKALPVEDVGRYRAAILKQSARPPGGDGGGLDTMGQLLLGRSELPRDYLAVTPTFIGLLQDGTGAWKAAGQLPSLKWNAAEANATTTQWMVLALARLQPTAETTAMSERALALE